MARSVNAVNPRAIIFTHVVNGAAPAGYVAMGFVRGDQFVEVAAADRNNNNALNFYLVRFTQACNVSGTCTDGDLLTPAIESNWLDVTVYDDVDLRNTVVDCLQCHQVNGPDTTKILRMQELEFPWPHWFRNNTAGSVLLADFRAAHGTTEDYAGIPANVIPLSDPEELEDLVLTAGFRQPNEFPTEVIEAEVRRTAGQPADNSVPGVSPTWDRIYANSVTAQAIAVPYHDVKVTDRRVWGRRFKHIKVSVTERCRRRHCPICATYSMRRSCVISASRCRRVWTDRVSLRKRVASATTRAWTKRLGAHASIST